MATTARGIVYPTVGDSLTPLSNHFAALATSTDTAINNIAADTGWVNLTSYLAVGYTAASFRGKKVGKVITLVCNDLEPSITSSTSAITFTTALPVEWRSNQNMWGVAVGQNFTIGAVLMRNVGTMAIVNNTGTTWTSTRFTATFLDAS